MTIFALDKIREENACCLGEPGYEKNLLQYAVGNGRKARRRTNMANIDKTGPAYLAGRNLFGAHQAPNPVDLDVDAAALGAALADRSAEVLVRQGATDAELAADREACIAHVLAGYEAAKAEVATPDPWYSLTEDQRAAKSHARHPDVTPRPAKCRSCHRIGLRLFAGERLAPYQGQGQAYDACPRCRRFDLQEVEDAYTAQG